MIKRCLLALCLEILINCVDVSSLTGDAVVILTLLSDGCLVKQIVGETGKGQSVSSLIRLVPLVLLHSYVQITSKSVQGPI